MNTSLLSVRGLHAGYGDLPVVHDMNLEVAAGEVVSLVGANGAGKTTLLKSIVGVVKPTAGTVTFDGDDIIKVPPHQIVTRGLAMVPEGRHLFPRLSVEENLLLGAYHREARRHADQVRDEMYDLFPRLSERRKQLAGSLSGGEQQMCAIARSLMSKPRLLMLDEPSLGLAPIIVEEVFALIRRLTQTGVTILLVEQNVVEALEMSDHGNVIDHGRVVLSGTGLELLDHPELQAAYFGIA